MDVVIRRRSRLGSCADRRRLLRGASVPRMLYIILLAGLVFDDVDGVADMHVTVCVPTL
jgi:hypothetical protein